MSREFLRAAADAVLDAIADDNVDALRAASVGATAATKHHLGHAAEGIAVLSSVLNGGDDEHQG